MNEKMTLTELQLLVKDSLYMAFPGMYWVTAEIAELKENYAGHCYLELVEKLPDGRNPKARARAIIWNNRWSFISSYFSNMTQQNLREGMKVMLKVKIEYHELYGLSLVVSDIDPAFTIGEMAVRRQMIIKRLEEEGIFDMNRELEFPLLPRRIAIISSRNAAGLSDFLNHLRTNSYGYTFRTTLFEASMQGTETENDVINALYEIGSDQEMFDVVTIIRGGGSQSDLSWFDNYNIAYNVTQFPLPVLTGIGHEKDLSVTDMVAYRSLKTPTAVADFLIGAMAETEEHILTISNDIAERSRLILESYRNLLDKSKMRLIPVAKMMVSDFRGLLSQSTIELIKTGKEMISRAGRIPSNLGTKLASASRTLVMSRSSVTALKGQYLQNYPVVLLKNKTAKLENLENALAILRPENVLRRGYTITSMNGVIVKESAMLREGDLIETAFRDGKIRSRVTAKKILEKKDQGDKKNNQKI